MFHKVQHINLLDEGDQVSDIFLVKEKKGFFDYADGSKWRFELTLADASGELPLKYWGGENKQAVEDLYESLAKNDVVFVEGRVQSFHDKLEINVNENKSGLKKLEAHQFAAGAFLKRGKANVESLWKELLVFIQNVKDPQIHALLHAFFLDETFVQSYKKSPASLYRHHAYVGGLLEHSLSVLKQSLLLSKNYVSLDKDLLIAGALLHDIGKTRTYRLGIRIEPTVEGELLGQVALGLRLLDEKMKTITLDEKKSLKLQHILASSLGKKGFGAAKKPAFAEALVISLAKNLDAQVDHIIAIENEVESEEDFYYHKDFGNIYLQ